MKKDELSPREHFNRLATDIGTAMFDIQMKMAGFIMEILESFDDYSADLDISVPLQKDNNFENIIVKKIFYNREDESLWISVSGDDAKIEWNNLNIVAQDLITTYLHIKYMAEDIFGDIS